MAELKSRRIREAEALARDLHATQKRKATVIPHIEHPMGRGEDGSGRVLTPSRSGVHREIQ